MEVKQEIKDNWNYKKGMIKCFVISGNLNLN